MTFGLLQRSTAAAAAAAAASRTAWRSSLIFTTTTRNRIVPVRSFASPRPTTTAAAATASKAVSMELLKELRQRTGAPIGECKRALEETTTAQRTTTSGSIDDAMDWLRQHGAAQAASKAGNRSSDEGLVGLKISDDHQTAALVRASSETDFASRSSAFCRLVTHVAHATMAADAIPSSSSSSGDGDGETSSSEIQEDAMLELKYDNKSVKDVMDETIVAIRENLGISSAKRLDISKNNNEDAGDGLLVGYVHGRVVEASSSPVMVGTAAAVVRVVPTKARDDGGVLSEQQLLEHGKKLAMHVVAAKPLYLTPQHVPEKVLNKEKDILKQQLVDSGKPPDIMEKIVGGKLRKFYEGVCLTEQPHMVEEGNPKVANVLDELGIQVTEFEAMSVS